MKDLLIIQPIPVQVLDRIFGQYQTIIFVGVLIIALVVFVTVFSHTVRNILHQNKKE